MSEFTYETKNRTNGLETYDRKVVKVTAEKMTALAKQLREALEGQTAEKL